MKKKVTVKSKRTSKRRSKKKLGFFSICLKVIIFISNSFLKYIIKPIYHLISFLLKKISEPISIKIKERVDQRAKKKKEDLQQEQEQMIHLQSSPILGGKNNVGFDKNAKHTLDKKNTFSNLKKYEIKFPLIHNNRVEHCKKFYNRVVKKRILNLLKKING